MTTPETQEKVQLKSIEGNPLSAHSYNLNKILGLNPLKQKLYLMGKYKNKKIVSFVSPENYKKAKKVK